MKRIASGISELYLTNTDGSDERILLSNESNYDYRASFSPDDQ